MHYPIIDLIKPIIEAIKPLTLDELSNAAAAVSKPVATPLDNLKTKTVEPTFQHGGGKNAQHKNEKAKESAKDKYENAKKQYDELNKKKGKTKEDNKELDKLEKQVKHWKSKADDTGENHNQQAKGH
jgi:hypothetical protein